MPETKIDYFQSVVGVAQEYLGPAAERFIRRQIDFHLEKDPANLTRKDVSELSKSVGVALGLLANDRELVDEASKKFKDIAKG
jgi:hypothetical protein